MVADQVMRPRPGRPDHGAEQHQVIHRAGAREVRVAFLAGEHECRGLHDLVETTRQRSTHAIEDVARIGDRRVPLLGRVSMDLVVFDVSDVDPALARPGGFIELLNENYGVDAAAADAGTIGYEILSALSRRYHRVYSGTSDQC